MGAQGEGAWQPNFDFRALENEGPVRLVKLGAYQIGKYPVTVAAYQRFVDGNGYTEERWWQAGGFGDRTEPIYWDEQIDASLQTALSG